MNPRSIRLTRRGVLLLAGGAIALPLALTSRDAGATIQWCKRDPIISFDGRVASIFVAAPADGVALVSEPVRVFVTVPRGHDDQASAHSNDNAAAHWRKHPLSSGVEVVLLSTDEGFGMGYDVHFKESVHLEHTADGHIEVKVAIYVATANERDDFPVLLEWQPESVGEVTASTEGTANRWVSLRTTI